MAVHELKTWPPYFGRVLSGRKTAEFRLDDRGFKEGDHLHLREWMPGAADYTGRDLTAVVKDVVHGGAFGIPEGYVVMSVRVVYPYVPREGAGLE